MKHHDFRNPIILLVLLGFALLGLTACGGPDTTSNRAESQVQYEGPTIIAQYDQCLEANPNLFGSPFWYRWVQDCKLRYGVED